MQGQPVSRGNQADANVLRKHKYTSMTLHDAADMIGPEHFTAMITEFISAHYESEPDECFRLANASINCITSMVSFTDVVNEICNDSAF